MNENIAEKLKDAPKRTKLWSPMLGDCYFEEYQKRESTYPIRVRFTNNHKETDYRNLSIYGKEVEVDSAECVLFPSKNHRTWKDFKAPWKHKHFEPFEKILITCQDDYNEDIWIADFYSHYKDGVHYTILYSGLYSGLMGISDDKIIPYKGNEDKLDKQANK